METSQAKKTKILLVEDDLNLGSILVDYLELLNYSVVHALDGEQGLQIYKNEEVDLAILDVMLPLKDGFTLAQEIRAENKRLPIVFLTALGQMDNRIAGFKSGADDYIAKPFSSEELALRIDAILRRCNSNGNLETNGNIKSFQIGLYFFDVENQELHLGSIKQTLTPKESGLLKVLCLNMNNLVTREKALTTVWGDDDYFMGRSMDVFITKLRKYLKDDPTVAIVNVHGSGFKLSVEKS